MPGPTYLSIVEIPGDGVTTQHEFNFDGGYISREHVKARITAADGAITEITVVDAMFVNDFTLDLGVAAPVGGVTRIYRETPRDLPLVDFSGGARITAANLDTMTRQAILAVAEAFDAGAYASVNDLLSVAGQAAATATAAAAAADEDAAAAVSAAATAVAAAANAVAALSTKLDKAGDTATGFIAVPAGATGDQVARVSELLTKAGNLAGLADPAAARTALGLGTAALRAALGTSGSLYSRDSIIGAVSQTGGVPTGAIIEVVTNANGTAVKFADGMMICTRTLSNVTTSSAQGSLFFSAPQAGSWAVPFASTPVVSVTGHSATVANCWAGSTNRSTTGFSTLVLFSTVNSATCGADIVAVGRWF